MRCTICEAFVVIESILWSNGMINESTVWTGRDGWEGIVVSKSHTVKRKTSAATQPTGSAATGLHSWLSFPWYAPNWSSIQSVMSRSQDFGRAGKYGVNSTHEDWERIEPRFKRSRMPTWCVLASSAWSTTLVRRQKKSVETPKNRAHNYTCTSPWACFSCPTPVRQIVVPMYPDQLSAHAVGRYLA